MTCFKIQFLDFLFRAEPVLRRIKEDNTILVQPHVFNIDPSTFAVQETGLYSIGFFWNMLFNYLPLTERQLRQRKGPTDPIKSVAVIGCAFGIHRDWFFHIGAFDEGMDIWGVENIDLPVRVSLSLCLSLSLSVSLSLSLSLSHTHTHKTDLFPEYHLTIECNDRG